MKYQRERAALALSLRRSGMTLKAVGERLGVTVERARQIVAKADRIDRRRQWIVDNPGTSAELSTHAVGVLVAMKVVKSYACTDAVSREVVRLHLPAIREDMAKCRNTWPDQRPRTYGKGEVTLDEIEKWVSG